MKHIKFILLALLTVRLLFSAPMPWATGQSKAENLTFYLVTFGPGDDIPSYWGHVALVVEDTVLRQSAIYNYGLYSFDNDMIFRFVMGRLIFEVGRASVSGYFNYYRRENREIRLTHLNIPLKSRLKLARFVEWNILPQNKKYLYHHYYDNCSTRLRDLLDQAVDGQFKQAMQAPASMTLRQHTRRYVARNPALEWLLMFLMSDRIDQPITKWDEMFLPDELERHVLAFSYTDSTGQQRSLASPTVIWFKDKRSPTPTNVPRHEWPVLFFGIFIGGLGLLLVLIQKRRPFRWFTLIFSLYNFLLGLVLGIPGLVLFFVMFFTEHDVTYGNENILLANPLTLLIAVFAIFLAREKAWAYKSLKFLWILQLAGAGLLILLKLILPSFDQDNVLAFCFIMPITIGMTISFLRLPESMFIDS
ncbi:Lnb N-terminal periplasmic domain-containing protein [Caldithrix abyssi]